MQTAGADVWSNNTRLALLAAVLLFWMAGFAQAPSPPPAPAPETHSSYLDPLPQDTGVSGLKLILRRLQNTGRLMMVTAHPDDEDGGVLTLQARGHGVQTVLLTLTRGEGGQNELGTGLFDKLGILRTLELLASDRYYGVEQRFTRVADFGYSKTPEETFQKWGGHDVPLGDMVRVIRTFRPDVLVARFSGTDRDGHGHHQASAILTREAFRAAADPNRFPDQIKEGLQPWQTKKLYIGNVCGFRSNTCADENWTIRFDTGEVDPVLGMSYLQMAMNGLAHQRSQGHGEFTVPAGQHYSFYKLVDSVLPNNKDASGHEKDFFDGIDVTLPGLTASLGADEKKKWPWLAEGLRNLANDAEAASRENQGRLLESVGTLRTLISRIAGSNIPAPVKNDLEMRLEASLELAQLGVNLGLNVSATNTARIQQSSDMRDQPSGAATPVSPGQRIQDDFTLHNGYAHALQIESLGMKKVPSNAIHSSPMLAPPHGEFAQQLQLSIPQSLCCTRPYWHRANPQTDSINTVDDPKLATLPLPPFPLEEQVRYSVRTQSGDERGPDPNVRAEMSVPLVAPSAADAATPDKQPVAVVPVFSVAVEPAEQVIPAHANPSIMVRVAVTSNLDAAPPGQLHLEPPAGWKVDPITATVSIAHRGEERAFEFHVSPSESNQAKVELRAVLDAGKTKYSEGYTLVTREDLGSFYYYAPAVQQVSIVDVKVPKDLKVAYIMGAGDDIPAVLQQAGMNVTVLAAEKLATENLSQYGSIVLGVRAYDAQKEVAANNQKLLDFVSNGGTLVVEHNNDTSEFNSGHFTPYSAELSRARVSVEDAPVQILAPDDPIFHFPNEITLKDFDGWVQERGLYFMDRWDDHFKPLLSCHDPNEPDQKGGLLVAKHGKGTYIYTGYAFYRQLPAGVPGAIRLFVNLVSAGKQN